MLLRRLCDIYTACLIFFLVYQSDKEPISLRDSAWDLVLASIKLRICSWGTFAEASQTRFPKEEYNGCRMSCPKSYQEVSRASNHRCQLLRAGRVLGSCDIRHATGVELLSRAVSSRQHRTKDVGTPHGRGTLREQTSCEGGGPGWQILLELSNRAVPRTQHRLPGGC